MELLELKKGDKVIYLGNMPYKLANGQEVEKEGEEMFVSSDVNVQKKFFKKIREEIKEVKNETNDVKVEAPKTKPKEEKKNSKK